MIDVVGTFLEIKKIDYPHIVQYWFSKELPRSLGRGYEVDCEDVGL